MSADRARRRGMAVIGSGPAAAAAAHMLAAAGHGVTVFDVGLRIEPHLEPLTRLPRPVDEAAFRAAVDAQRRRVLGGDAAALPPKLPFGSDFVYRSIPGAELSTAPGMHIVTSLALGGLSNAWGANVCAIAGRDMADWPIGEADLTPYYKALAAITDVSGRPGDDIDELYAAPLPAAEHYPLGLHGRRLLESATGRAAALRTAGIHCGRAKIAVGPLWSLGGVGCAPCGLCMHGCPQGAIFNAGDVIRSLAARGAVTYLDRRLVLRFVEAEDGVTLFSRPADGGPVEERVFDRVFIAGGVFGSTALVARSLGWCDRTYVIRDSQKYYFPFLRYRRAAGARREKTNTLAQIFIQDAGLRHTPHIVHCQLYGLNDLVFESLQAKLGPAAALLEKWGAPFFERLMIGMVYFHSDDSGALLYRVPADPDAGLGHVEAGDTPDTGPLFREFTGRLSRFADAFGGRPLGFLAERSPPGHSMHFGGSLPMSADPAAGRTDRLGRPFGCRRVHVVDTSVLPSIPGTPTTYVIMANAARICAAIGGDEA